MENIRVKTSADNPYYTLGGRMAVVCIATARAALPANASVAPGGGDTAPGRGRANG